MAVGTRLALVAFLLLQNTNGQSFSRFEPSNSTISFGSTSSILQALSSKSPYSSATYIAQSALLVPSQTTEIYQGTTNTQVLSSIISSDMLKSSPISISPAVAASKLSSLTLVSSSIMAVPNTGLSAGSSEVVTTESTNHVIAVPTSSIKSFIIEEQSSYLLKSRESSTSEDISSSSKPSKTTSSLVTASESSSTTSNTASVSSSVASSISTYTISSSTNLPVTTSMSSQSNAMIIAESDIDSTITKIVSGRTILSNAYTVVTLTVANTPTAVTANAKSQSHTTVSGRNKKIILGCVLGLGIPIIILLVLLISYVLYTKRKNSKRLFNSDGKLVHLNDLESSNRYSNGTYYDEASTVHEYVEVEKKRTFSITNV
ncbi:hypothetical protein KAFR_0F03730 [Kazachstania africana CBS 2517]|uniref:Mid2 domain-containing protein n=1 Tax=Kazachstania africana (strain ATCC 22294 / BCRC 22015 / CBS 2517 / CECT 1963 / NBRC 1671 / NRRL Y-8276) TaxID=1071382 RepID=H2AX69_KAZAF|nr:hypothetical protein KAFR_0F03730 [Kazachstania africana CBS 2517]CCF58969.1 hypothetical protein KAFR_0F03730 [Kazachstania africana CBS 2517]